MVQSRRFVSGLVLCLVLFPWMSGLFAQQLPQPPSSHVAAAVRMLEAFEFREFLTAPVRRFLAEQRAANSPSAERLTAVMEPLLTPEYIYGELAPFLATLIDESALNELANMFEGPTGRKILDTQRVLYATGKEPPLVFTDVEKTQIREFERTTAYVQFVAAMPVFQKRMQEQTRQTNERIREALRR